MKNITCIFFGRSGSGKGTQADLLLKYLAKNDPHKKVVYIEMGAKFRKIKESGTYAAERIKKVVNAGGFLPVFLPVYVWTDAMVHEITGNEHVVFDGVCRQPEEGAMLDAAMKFFDLEKPTIFLLDVHHEEARKRLIARGRHDDKHEAITARFEAYEREAMPSIKYFEKSPNCRFVTINGDQPIEKVHEDVIRALGI